jgi:hypothetical protein
MKTCGGVDVYIHIFLTSALAGGEWSASRLRRFATGERAPGTHGIGGWVDPRAGLDDRDSKSDTSVSQPVASRYTDYAIKLKYKMRKWINSRNSNSAVVVVSVVIVIVTELM